jgi:hypothetical protein
MDGHGDADVDPPKTSMVFCTSSTGASGFRKSSDSQATLPRGLSVRGMVLSQ